MEEKTGVQQEIPANKCKPFRFFYKLMLKPFHINLSKIKNSIYIQTILFYTYTFIFLDFFSFKNCLQKSIVIIPCFLLQPKT